MPWYKTSLTPTCSVTAHWCPRPQLNEGWGTTVQSSALGIGVGRAVGESPNIRWVLGMPCQALLQWAYRTPTARTAWGENREHQGSQEGLGTAGVSWIEWLRTAGVSWVEGSSISSSISSSLGMPVGPWDTPWDGFGTFWRGRLGAGVLARQFRRQTCLGAGPFGDGRLGAPTSVNPN